MDESTAEALAVILDKHWDDDCDEHQYTTKESMQDALKKAYELGLSARPEVAKLTQKEQAASDVLLALVGLKLYKDRIGKDEHYEAEQPKAWALAREYLQHAMPEEYATVEAGISALSPRGTIGGVPPDGACSEPDADLTAAAREPQSREVEK